MKPKRALVAVCLVIGVVLSLFLFRRHETAMPPGASQPNTSTRQVSAPLRAPAAAAAGASQSNGRAPSAAPSPEREAHLAAFDEWLQRYETADAAARPSLEADGIALAQQRRAAMFSLIQTHPDRALALALPPLTRQRLPAAIAPFVEQHVSARGDYEVLATVPLPELMAEVQPIRREVKLNDGRAFRAFPVQARRDFPTQRGIPLGGIALDDVMAVGNPVRVLSTEEAQEFADAGDPVCSISGQLAANGSDPTPVEVGGDLHWMCSYEHGEWWNEKLLAAAGQPGGSSIEGGAAKSNYTEGRKRIILFRVAFPNVTTPALTVQQGHNMLTNMNVYWRTISYGRTTVAMPGQGSDVVLVTLSQNTTNYDDDAGKLRADVRAAATASGVDLSKYDFDITCVGSQPQYSFAGLAYVGAPGAWLANGYFNTATTGHELGHNLGAPHANFWDTGGASAIGPGANDEYGDPFDIMGGGGTPQGHYVAKFKWRIGWLSDADFPRITTSGRHRIYAQDHEDATGVRGLRFGRNGSMDYYVEFRQLYTGNNWMMNGLRLCWGGNGSSWSSQFIDTTPGSPGNKNDSPIVIGQTFTDPAANVHITPIGKGNTYPESLDVIVNFGTAATNQPPIVALGASATSIPAGGSVNFNAVATDPNGDTLAYYWDFDDGGYSVNNSPAQARTFSSAGDYHVRCTVSDTRGGRTTKSVLVRVGTPTTFTISGRVLDDHKPVEGVLMKAGSRTTYTASDGTYTLTRLGAGSYSVTATLYPYNFISPWSPSTTSVGPSKTNIDFINLPGGIPMVTLVSTGAVWKYLDNGSDQGTAWRAPAFNDLAWASGRGQLGYGDGDEATVVSYGPDANNKHITTYFRHSFVVTNPASLTNLALELHRDDGGVVYLNGNEVFRDNMPSGAIGYRTLAVSGVEGATVRTNVSSSLLLTGTNHLAVEIHQVQVDSSDTSFDLALSGASTSSSQTYSAIYVASPGDDAQITTPTNVTISANGFASGDSFTLVEFYTNGVKLGEDASAPYTAAWNNPAAGTYTLTVRGTLASGRFATSAPVRVTVSPPVAAPTSITLVPSGATWRYLDNGSDQGSAWIAPGFNDGSWASGAAELGYGDGDEATVVSFGPNSSAKHITTYFRRAFTVEDPSVITNLTVGVLRDDGAIVYLNGVEVFRDNLPPVAVTYTTPALTAIEDNNTFYAASVEPSLLVAGTNVLAVEIHQESGTSSDISFDLRLTGLASGARPRGVYLTSPEDGRNFAAPADVPLAAIAVPGGGQSITRVEFYAANNQLGEDTAAPFAFTWTNAPTGTFQLTARAFESGGAVLTSAPVSVTITAPPLGTQLISRGELWRYLDNGSDQGTAWASRTFNDSSWKRGHARLGYGGDGETTVVSYGPDANKRHVTTYFRKSFVLGSTANIANLKLLLARDDGAVVYLNGVEVHRSNLLTNAPVSYNSLATATMNGADETNFTAYDISRTPLVTGTNVLAIEVHQAAVNSSDLGMDAELIAERATNISSGIYISAPANGAHFTLPTAVNVEAFVSAPGGTVNQVTFTLDDASPQGDTTAPYATTYNNPAIGAHVLRAVALIDGTFTITSPPVNITVDGPPAQITPVFETFITAGAAWRYWSNGVTPAGSWTALNYDDGAWQTGNAKFGWGLDGETTTLPSGRTHYFRRTFVVSNAAALDNIVVHLQRDDGAVVYLNGVEQFRSNMPIGPVTSGTLATSTVDGLDEQTFFAHSFPAAGILSGTNVLAVEIHQQSTSSSDMGFDLQLEGYGTTGPSVVIGSPANNQLFVAPAHVPIEAYANAGSGRTISLMEFYANGAKLGDSAGASPFQFTWTNAPIGTHTLVARALDNFGASITSAPVNIRVGYQPVSLQLINSNAVWKYLDDGSNQGTNWAQPGFHDAAWASGPAELGYGDAEDGRPEATVVSFGANPVLKHITTYFRRTFIVPPDAVLTNATVRLLRDDGAVVWLNGRELFRSNMPTGTIGHTTPASSAVSGSSEATYFVTELATTNFVSGTNVLAVEVHQNSSTSSDLSFDLQFEAGGYVFNDTPPALVLATMTNGQVRLSWPASAAAYELRGSPRLGASASWQPIPGTPAVSNGQKVITLPATNEAQFFRLQKP